MDIRTSLYGMSEARVIRTNDVKSGSTDDYCLSANCDPNFGICPGSVSPNGLCGSANYDYTCKGSTFGDCCSAYGYWSVVSSLQLCQANKLVVDQVMTTVHRRIATQPTVLVLEHCKETIGAPLLNLN